MPTDSYSIVHLTFSIAILEKLSTSLLLKNSSTTVASMSIMYPRSLKKLRDTNASLALINMLNISSKQRKFLCLIAKFSGVSPF